MKFKITSNSFKSNSVRLGSISFNNDTSYETPSCMIYTTSGCVPNLTNDSLKLIPHLPNIMEVPLASLVDNLNLFKSNPKLNIKNFLNIKDYNTFITFQDTGKALKQGFNEGKKLALWLRNGKLFIDNDMFNDVIKTFKSEIIECAYDGETYNNSANKRLKKSYDRTKYYVDDVFDNEEKKENICMPLIGGFDSKIRQQFVDDISKYEYSAITIQGLQPNSSDLEKFDFEDIKELIKDMNDEIYKKDPNIFKTILLVLRPDNVVKGVDLGIDLFSGSYPYYIAQRGEASIFKFKMASNENDSDSDEPIKKRPKIEETLIETNTENIINLKDLKYKQDFTPILQDCLCYTCKNYTKAYLNHLFECKELLSFTLVAIHNMTQYYSFFEEIRNAIKSNNFESYKNFIIEQFKK